MAWSSRARRGRRYHSRRRRASLWFASGFVGHFWRAALGNISRAPKVFRDLIHRCRGEHRAGGDGAMGRGVPRSNVRHLASRASSATGAGAIRLRELPSSKPMVQLIHCNRFVGRLIGTRFTRGDPRIENGTDANPSGTAQGTQATDADSNLALIGSQSGSKRPRSRKN